MAPPFATMRVLAGFAPKFWNETRQQPQTQQLALEQRLVTRLAARVARRAALERDVTSGTFVVRTIYDSHAAAAERALDTIAFVDQGADLIEPNRGSQRIN